MQSHSTADVRLPRDSQGNTDFAALVRQLKECPTLQDQADILYILYIMKYKHRDNLTRRQHWNTNNWFYIIVSQFISFLWSEDLIGWWSCQIPGRAGSVCAPCWRSCTCKLEPAKSGDSSDTSLGYYTREWRSLPRSVSTDDGKECDHPFYWNMYIFALCLWLFLCTSHYSWKSRQSAPAKSYIAIVESFFSPCAKRLAI